MLNWADVIKFANYGNPTPDRRVAKSEEEWRTQLAEEEFRVTRKKGTEARFSGELCSRYDPGLYACVCCDSELFDSGEKFDSKTGWPSFTQPVNKRAVKYVKDGMYGMMRIETLCNACDAHLGHIFPDGPRPSGLRYCINSVSLKKIENNDK
ncbi:UNVERIFIED_CONTAM: hypothetical protein GTU68_030748 [Idotea baltica]|nr:hypothetical protein [Idotea baltica]